MQLLFPLEEPSLHPSLRGRLGCNAALGGRVEGFSFFKEIDHFYADQRMCEAWKQQRCSVSSQEASVSEPFQRPISRSELSARSSAERTCFY